MQRIISQDDSDAMVEPVTQRGTAATTTTTSGTTLPYSHHELPFLSIKNPSASSGKYFEIELGEDDYINDIHSPAMFKPPTPISPTSSFGSTSAKQLFNGQVKKQQSTTLQAILNEYCDLTMSSSTASLEEASEVDDENCKYVHEIASIRGLRHQFYLELVFWILVASTAGLLLICCRWIKWMRAYLTYTYSNNRGESFENATKVIIESKDLREWTICKIKKGYIRNYDSDQRVSIEPIRIRYFLYRNLVFIYDPDLDSFHRVRFNTSLPYSKIHKMAEQEAENERDLRELLFGKNSTQVPMKSMIQILLDEILHPFYLFQILILVLWFIERYYIYCITISVVSLIAVFFSFWRTHDNLKKLKEMTSYHCYVNRLTQRAPSSFNRTIYSEDHTKKNEEIETMDSLDLTPGDIIEITNGMVMPCDVILLGGQLIVNESKLTGDSIPVKKRALPRVDDIIYDASRDSTYTVYSGTTILSSQPSQSGLFANKCYGIVSQTGFHTQKGKLILSILYPKTGVFNIYRDSFKFLFVLVFSGFIGMLATIITMVKAGQPSGNIILHVLDIISITVPPSLPIAMTTTVTFTMRRLAKRRIFCTSPARVNISGYVKIVIFDKTNTLTRRDIDVNGIIPSQKGSFEHYVKKKDFTTAFSADHALLRCLACCNDLSRIKTNLVGDPLDIALFRSTNWDIQEYSEAVTKHTLLYPHRNMQQEKNRDDSFSRIMVNEFKSSLQRMSVMVRDNTTGDVWCFVKGSAESIKSISKPSSIPGDFNIVLRKYAQKGYRILACGVKKMNEESISSQKSISREEIESDLEFVGLALVENKVKKGAFKAVKTLTDCNIKCIMVTGDNPYTSITIGKKSHIIESRKAIFLSELKENSDKTIPHTTNYSQNIFWRNVDTNHKISTQELLTMQNIELVITGEVFEYVLKEHRKFVKSNRREPYINTKKPSLLHVIVTSCNIYSRFSPYNKKILVEELQKMGYDVGMVGDGSNDLFALQTAHTGISLADTETSIAAPFTSLKPRVSSIVTLIREGRASLLTFFQIFKFTALYAITRIITVQILLQRNCNLSNFQYLYIDLFVILPTTLLMTRTDASLALKREKPPNTLISRFIFLSLLGHVLLAAGFLWMVWTEIEKEPWFHGTTEIKFKIYRDIPLRSYEATIMFFICTFCIINIAICMSISKPFKLPIITNNCKFLLKIH